MSFDLRSSALACALLAPLVFHGAASAQPNPGPLTAPTQNLSFTVVGSGLATGGSGSGTRVIETAADYKAFTGQDAPASVHFGTKKGDDVVLAIRRDGWLVGGKITIDKVVLGFEGVVQGYVSYAEKGGPPKPGTLPPVGDVFVAVKVARPSAGFAKFVFRDDSHPHAFTKIELDSVAMPAPGSKMMPITKHFSIDKNGDWSLDMNGGTPTKGSLGIAQLLDLESKFDAAQVDTLPSDVTQVVHIVAPSATFSVDATYPGGEAKFHGEPGIYAASVGARVKPLMDLLTKLENDAVVAPLAAWDKLSYGLSSGSTGKSSTLTLQSDGSAHLVQSSPGAKFAPIDGKATASELDAVNAAAKKANLATLPDMIPNPAMIMGATELTLGSTVAGKAHTLHATVGFLASYKTRLQPLLDALAAIQTRLANQANEIDILGTVGVSADAVTITKAGGPIMVGAVNPAWRVTNEPFYSLLKGMKGQLVEAHARMLPGIEPVITVLSLRGSEDKASNLRDAAGKTIESIPAGSSVEVVGVKGQNYQVQFDGKTGYVKKASVNLHGFMVPLATPSATTGLTHKIGSP